MNDTVSAPHELSVSRLIAAPQDAVYRAYTEHLPEWWAPRPYTTPAIDIDLRAGGRFSVTMRSPDGEDMPTEGVLLEVVPGERLVFTDAFRTGWVPQASFMVVIVTFADENGQTRYTARVRHWDAEACAKHEAMGFAQGWALCADQLAEVAERIAVPVA